jgi:hypothetical protein
MLPVQLLYLLIAVSAIAFRLIAETGAWEWLPLGMGDRWTHLNENLNEARGGLAHPEIILWSLR